MMKRWGIRFGVYGGLALAAGFLFHGGRDGWLATSFFLLCLIYSGRLLWTYVSPALGTLVRFGFLAVLFGSIPAILIILLIFFLFAGAMAVACILLGCIQIVLEFLSAVRADNSI